MPTKDLQIPWTDYPVAAPEAQGQVSISGHGGQLPDSEGAGESENSVSGLPKQPTITTGIPDAPGANAQVPIPDLKDRIPGTIKT